VQYSTEFQIALDQLLLFKHTKSQEAANSQFGVLGVTFIK